MRFQIQEMARVEKLVTDEGIQDELDIYNPMIPEPGQLCATLFLELTTDDQMREWLPKLVGIERSFVFVLDDGDRIALDHRGGRTRASSPARTSPPRCTTSDSSSRRNRSMRSPPVGCVSRSPTPSTSRRSNSATPLTPSCSATCVPDAARISTGASATVVLDSASRRRRGESNRSVATGIEMVGSRSMPRARRVALLSRRRRGRRGAKAVCAGCHVQDSCLEHALSFREKAGVWGGATERDRRRMIRQRRRIS